MALPTRAGDSVHALSGRCCGRACAGCPGSWLRGRLPTGRCPLAPRTRLPTSRQRLQTGPAALRQHLLGQHAKAAVACVANWASAELGVFFDRAQDHVAARNVADIVRLVDADSSTKEEVDDALFEDAGRDRLGTLAGSYGTSVLATAFFRIFTVIVALELLLLSVGDFRGRRRFVPCSVRLFAIRSTARVLIYRACFFSPVDFGLLFLVVLLRFSSRVASPWSI